MGFFGTRRGKAPAGLISIETAEEYRAAGRLDEALPMLEQAVSYYERRWGVGDPDTVTFRVYMAAAYQEVGRLDQAIPHFEAALADTERELGPDHPNTLAW